MDIEIYLCIDNGGNQIIRTNPINDYFINYYNDMIMIRLEDKIVKQISEVLNNENL